MSEKCQVRDHDRPYFITITVTGWVDVFTRKNHRMAIVDSFVYCQEHKGLEIFAWCLMSNHLHMIARAAGEITIPEIVRDFKKHTSKTIVKLIQDEPESRREWMLQLFAERASEVKRVNGFKLWQDGFHPIELYGNKIIKQKVDYIHNNPVEEYYVSNPEHWMFSSAVDYADMDGLLKVTPRPRRSSVYRMT